MTDTPGTQPPPPPAGPPQASGGQPISAPQPAGFGGYAPPTNTLAIIALIGAFVVPIVGIVCGHLALAQVKRTGEGGRSLALAGMIIGYAYTALVIVIIVVSVAIPLFVLAAVGAGGGFN